MLATAERCQNKKLNVMMFNISLTGFSFRRKRVNNQSRHSDEQSFMEIAYYA